MTPDEYQKWAATKWNGGGINCSWGPPNKHLEQVLNAALGLMGEGGEYVDIVKKIMFHQLPIAGAAGHENDMKLKNELGDVAFYLAINCLLWGWTLEDILETNKAKLDARYPDGFDAERSNNRAEE